jgi:hypothetical protein
LPPVKQKALKILGEAYRLEKDYDRAALALLGQWKDPEGKDERTVTVGKSLGGNP